MGDERAMVEQKAELGHDAILMQNCLAFDWQLSEKVLWFRISLIHQYGLYTACTIPGNSTHVITRPIFLKEWSCYNLP